MGLQSVGVAGFEPATLWSQTRCANRAALHPAETTGALAEVVIKSSRKNRISFSIYNISQIYSFKSILTRNGFRICFDFGLRIFDFGFLTEAGADLAKRNPCYNEGPKAPIAAERTTWSRIANPRHH